MTGSFWRGPNPNGAYPLSGPFRAVVVFALLPWVSPTAIHGLPLRGRAFGQPSGRAVAGGEFSGMLTARLPDGPCRLASVRGIYPRRAHGPPFNLSIEVE